MSSVNSSIPKLAQAHLHFQPKPIWVMRTEDFEYGYSLSPWGKEEEGIHFYQESRLIFFCHIGKQDEMKRSRKQREHEQGKEGEERKETGKLVVRRSGGGVWKMSPCHQGKDRVPLGNPGGCNAETGVSPSRELIVSSPSLPPHSLSLSPSLPPPPLLLLLISLQIPPPVSRNKHLLLHNG